MTERRLRDAGEMLGPAVAALGEALDPPAADLLALAAGDDDRRHAARGGGADAAEPCRAAGEGAHRARRPVPAAVGGPGAGAPADGLERLGAAGSAGNGGAPAAGPYWWQGSLKEGLQLG